MRFSLLKVAILSVTAVQLIGCDRSQQAEDDRDTTRESAESAVSSQYQDRTEQSSMSAANMQAAATLASTQGNSASGVVQFQQGENGMLVSADIRGLSVGMHGFHIHENGDCSAADASSAGGHFNPNGTDHGAPDGDSHHIGDLGNIEANDVGRATIQQVFPFLSLSGENSVMGKAVVVHAGADDLTSQPSGAAGSRVACGVIQAASDY